MCLQVLWIIEDPSNNVMKALGPLSGAKHTCPVLYTISEGYGLWAASPRSPVPTWEVSSLRLKGPNAEEWPV